MPYLLPQSRVLHEAAMALLQAITPQLDVYDGLVPEEPPADVLGVHPHCVMYPSPGAGEASLAAAEAFLRWSFQVTCVGGTVIRCLSAADRVRAALDGARLDVSGHGSGLIHPPAGYSPGPVVRDDDPTPPRYWVPLQFTVTIT